MGHALKGESDDGGGVEADAEFEQKQPPLGGAAHKLGIALRLAVPVGILHKGVVNSQIHGHGLAVGHVGDEVGGDAAVAYRRQDTHDPVVVVHKGCGAARKGLEETVVALGGEEAVGVKTGQLKLAVDIGGDDEMAFVRNQVPKVAIELGSARAETGEPDVLGPVGPTLLVGGEGIEGGGVEVGETVTPHPRLELALEV